MYYYGGYSQGNTGGCGCNTTSYSGGYGYPMYGGGYGGGTLLLLRLGGVAAAAAQQA